MYSRCIHYVVHESQARYKKTTCRYKVICNHMYIPSLQTMDSQGLLKPEHGSASVRAQGRQRRSSSGQVIISPDDDSWVKCSPAYLQLQDE